MHGLHILGVGREKCTDRSQNVQSLGLQYIIRSPSSLGINNPALRKVLSGLTVDQYLQWRGGGARAHVAREAAQPPLRRWQSHGVRWGRRAACRRPAGSHNTRGIRFFPGKNHEPMTMPMTPTLRRSTGWPQIVARRTLTLDISSVRVRGRLRMSSSPLP